MEGFRTRWYLDDLVRRRIVEKHCGTYLQKQKRNLELHQLLWDQVNEPYHITFGESDRTQTMT